MPRERVVIIDTKCPRCGDLQTRLQRMTDIAADQRRILDLCPMGLPDGTGIMTAEGWIKWAKRRLGYTEVVNSNR